jgi:hypothetical protein
MQRLPSWTHIHHMPWPFSHVLPSPESTPTHQRTPHPPIWSDCHAVRQGLAITGQQTSLGAQHTAVGHRAPTGGMQQHTTWAQLQGCGRGGSEGEVGKKGCGGKRGGATAVSRSQGCEVFGVGCKIKPSWATGSMQQDITTTHCRKPHGAGRYTTSGIVKTYANTP